MKENVTKIDEDLFELSSPVRYSVSELKTKIKESEDKLIQHRELKQRIINDWDKTIAEEELIKSSLEAKLAKAADAGMEV